MELALFKVRKALAETGLETWFHSACFQASHSVPDPSLLLFLARRRSVEDLCV